MGLSARLRGTTRDRTRRVILPDSGPRAKSSPPERTSLVSMSQCRTSTCRLACAVLVDQRGWLLLQERDEFAPVDPDVWGLVGGHAHPEESFAEAAVRELAEETEIDVMGDPRVSNWRLWWAGDLPAAPKATPDLTDSWQIWIGATTLTDDDVVCHEGRQIVFVDPQTLPELQLGRGPQHLLPLLCASSDYQAMVREGLSKPAPAIAAEDAGQAP